MTNSQFTIYPYGLVAQWIEHCTGIVVDVECVAFQCNGAVNNNHGYNDVRRKFKPDDLTGH